MKKKLITCLLISVASIFLFACGSQATMASAVAYDTAEVAEEAYYNGEMSQMKEAPSSYEGNSTGQVTESAQNTNRKLIKNISLTVETKSFEEIVENISGRVDELGGYIENMDGSYGSRYSSFQSGKYMTLVCRIPTAKLDEFVYAVGQQGNITYRNESVEDVTLHYVDMESHKRMLVQEQDRLLELMEQAETVEDIIAIESRLTEVRYEIDSMESQLRAIDNKIDYSTVTLNINEVIDYSDSATEEKTVGERISDGIVASLHSLADGIVEFFVWFVINIPFILLFAIIIILVVIIIKKIKKKRRGPKENE